MLAQIPFTDGIAARIAALPAFPTMCDLPSEDPEEPGLPDEFHNLQPQLQPYPSAFGLQQSGNVYRV